MTPHTRGFLLTLLGVLLLTPEALIVRLIGIVIFGLLAWRCWLRADDAALFNEATNMVEVPFQPFFWILSAASLFQTIILIVECARLIGGKTIGHDIPLADMPEDAASAD